MMEVRNNSTSLHEYLLHATFFFFLPCYKAYGLVPQPGIEPVAPEVKFHVLTLGLQGSPCMSLITMGAQRCHVFDECPL